MSNLDLNNLKKQILAVLFLMAEEVKISTIINNLKIKDIQNEDIENAIIELAKDLEKLGLIIIKSEAKTKDNIQYKLVLSNEYTEIAESIRKEELEGALTPAALQVLTICAYLGASSKSQISFIRGVQSTQSIRSLMVRGLLKKVSEKYVLSIDAIQNLGIKQIEDLPEYDKIKQDFKERLAELIITENDDEK